MILKLSLQRETLRSLGPQELRAVAGGALSSPCQFQSDDCNTTHTTSAGASITRLSQPTGPRTCHISSGS